MPLTETINTLPENEFDLTLGGEFVRGDYLYRRDSAELGLGLTDDLSLHYGISYNHRLSGPGGDEIGDSFLRVWYFIGSFCENRLHAGIAGTLRIPMGPVIYENTRWKDVSLGVGELTFGPAVQWEWGPVYLHGNLFYTFREGEGEGLMSGFRGNLTSRETYESAFGFNPFHDGAFLDRDRLKNDYISTALAINTGALYPVVPFVEAYYSQRVYRRVNENDHIPVEGAGVNPLLAGAGVRYFISGDFYAGIHVIVPVLRKSGYHREVAGFFLSIQY